MASLIVGLLGLKRSGKDSFASRLVEAHGFTRVAFADPLKEAALALNPIIDRHDDGGFWRLRTLVDIYGWERAKELDEVRRTLQDFGIGIRAIQEDFWLNAAVCRVWDTPGPVVITDVRFPNEVGYVARHGYTVRVVRPGLVNADTHVSENSVNDVQVDFSVANDGTLDDLSAKADELARLLLTP